MFSTSTQKKEWTFSSQQDLLDLRYFVYKDERLGKWIVWKTEMAISFCFTFCKFCSKLWYISQGIVSKQTKHSHLFLGKQQMRNSVQNMEQWSMLIKKIYFWHLRKKQYWEILLQKPVLGLLSLSQRMFKDLKNS